MPKTVLLCKSGGPRSWSMSSSSSKTSGGNAPEGLSWACQLSWIKHHPCKCMHVYMSCHDICIWQHILWHDIMSCICSVILILRSLTWMISCAVLHYIWFYRSNSSRYPWKVPKLMIYAKISLSQVGTDSVYPRDGTDSVYPETRDIN
jgi:hypothetical protein